MRSLLILFRVTIGAIFVFSGFVKGVDPWGSAYKFIDYFQAFHISWLNSLALTLGVILSLAEFMIGVCLIFNLKIRVALRSALVFMVFFTCLTLVIAIFNPVTDCGCFGDALKLSNWETFWKNVIIMVPLIITIKKKHLIKSYLDKRFQNRLIALFTISFLILTIHCYRHLPIIDFRPYNVGTNITEKMTIPEGAAEDEYRTELIYKKGGKTETFTMENLPDSTWEFVDSKSTIIKRGYEAPIHDFVIHNDRGEDLTTYILNSEETTFIFISSKLDKSNTDKMVDIQKLFKKAIKTGSKFIGITASTEEEIKIYKSRHKIEFPIYNMDEIQLKTIIRSNPGIVKLKKGTIEGKWHYNDIENIIIK